MVPFWADVSMTTWFEMIGLLAAFAACLATILTTQGHRC